MPSVYSSLKSVARLRRLHRQYPQPQSEPKSRPSEGKRQESIDAYNQLASSIFFTFRRTRLSSSVHHLPPLVVENLHIGVIRCSTSRLHLSSRDPMKSVKDCRVTLPLTPHLVWEDLLFEPLAVMADSLHWLLN